MKIERMPVTSPYPLPIYLVTVGVGDQANIITIAWGGTVNQKPPMAAIAVRTSRHSYELLCRTREFVINVPRAAQAELVDRAGVESGRTVDKFQTYGLTRAPAAKVEVPLIEECPVNVECAVRHQLELGSHDLFIGEVLAVQYDEELLDDAGELMVDRLDSYVYMEGEYRALGETIGTHGFSVKKARAREEGGS